MTAGDTVPLLSVQGLSVRYRTARGVHAAVRDVSFDVAGGSVLALVGESGSGKTTLGHSILGLLPENGQVTGGSISFRGTALSGLTRRELRQLRGGSISLIPQDPTVSLDPVRRVGDQVQDVLRFHARLDSEGRRRKVLELFELVGFQDPARVYRQYPHELSGGMRQRVLIASAVAVEPELIIADEPTSGLDATVQTQVLDLIDTLRRRAGTTLVLITHDLGVAADRSDVLCVMQQGRLVESGPTQEVVRSPSSAYAQRLLDSVPSRLTLQRRRADPGLGQSGPAIEVRDLTKDYGGSVVVDAISFSVGYGNTLAVVGESGSGKTTTARVLAGLAKPTSGSVSLLGTDVTRFDTRQFRALRRDVQIIFQNPFASFDPRFAVYDVVEEPLRSFRPAQLPGRRRRANRDRVIAALEAAALPAEFASRRPRELSGGQRQRVAIARALVIEPKILILDEPVSALDVSVQAQILELLCRLQDDLGLTYVFISHDLGVVRAISDEVVVMRAGRIVEAGTVSRVFDHPVSPYTAQLLNAASGRHLAAVEPTSQQETQRAQETR